MPKMRLWPGLLPGPAGGAYSAPPGALAGFNGTTSKRWGGQGRSGKGEGRGREGKGRGERGQGEGRGRGIPVLLFPPLQALIWGVADEFDMVEKLFIICASMTDCNIRNTDYSD